MRFLMDTQQETLRQRMAGSDLIQGQLMTPLTRYAYWGGVYAIDNGAFSSFNEDGFRRLLERQASHRAECLFVTAPDIVGAGQRSLELFQRRSRWIPEGWPVALVAPDGAENLEIPWDDMAAVFVGGRDPWKDSAAAADIVRTAKILGVHVHVGRVNTPKRFDHFVRLGADTCDGSGVAMYDHMLEAIEQRDRPCVTLFDAVERSDQSNNRE